MEYMGTNEGTFAEAIVSYGVAVGGDSRASRPRPRRVCPRWARPR